MSLEKNVEIRVLSETWSAGIAPPPPLVAAQHSSPYAIDVLSSLIFAAIWTRPPVQYGFSLSDCWAWLRYFPAIAANSELRLREEWTTLDPHHKTVLSGDFGVGFTTWFLSQTLGFGKYADTLWVINTLHPGLFQIGHTTRRGPNKSPDYIAQDSHGRFSILECKGTQTSLRGLRDAIDRGMPQKANVQTLGGTHIQHSIVAGLFVPQFESLENPVIAVADPDWQKVREQLEKYSADELDRGTSQIAYAKETALFDLPLTANALSRAKGSAESIAVALQRDLQQQAPGRTVTPDELRVSHEYRWQEPAKVSDDLAINGVRFEGSLPATEIEKLMTIASPSAQGDRKREDSRDVQWKAVDHGSSVELRSPLGSTFRLELLEA